MHEVLRGTVARRHLLLLGPGVPKGPAPTVLSSSTANNRDGALGVRARLFRGRGGGPGRRDLGFGRSRAPRRCALELHAGCRHSQDRVASELPGCAQRVHGPWSRHGGGGHAGVDPQSDLGLHGAPLPVPLLAPVAVPFRAAHPTSAPWRDGSFGPCVRLCDGRPRTRQRSRPCRSWSPCWTCSARGRRR